MEKLVWSPEMSVGLDLLDEEHKQWIAYVNELHEKLEEKCSHEEICVALSKIEECAREHFKTEEAAFCQTSYPDVAFHKRLHQEHLKEMAELRALCKTTNPETAIPSSLFVLKKWLLHHIQEVDAQYVPYLKELAK